MKLIEIYNSIFEVSDYDQVQDMNAFLKQRKKRMEDFAVKKYNEFYDKIFDKYGTPEEKKYRDEFVDSDSMKARTEYFNARDRIEKLLTPDEVREAEKVKKWYVGSNLKSYDAIHWQAAKQYMNSYQKFTSKFKDAYGFRGDLKSKYAYHLTNADRLLSILDDDVMYTGDNNGVSLSTFKNLIKRKPIFYHGSVDYTTIGAQIVFDLPKIIEDNYKIRLGADDDVIGTHFGEEELSIRSEFENVSKYIVKVILFVNHIEPNDLKELTSELKKRNIPYYLNSKVNFK